MTHPVYNRRVGSSMKVFEGENGRRVWSPIFSSSKERVRGNVIHTGLSGRDSLLYTFPEDPSVNKVKRNKMELFSLSVVYSYLSR